jgi:nitrous oxidase accessory protein NosD
MGRRLMAAGPHAAFVALVVGLLFLGGRYLMAGGPNTVVLPAGSVDALAAAIAQAGSGGTVLVKSGLHQESGSVLVTQPVTIAGEAGAVLESGTLPGAQYPIVIQGAIDIKGTQNVSVSGLEFRPLEGNSAASTAVLIEHSSNVVVASNVMTNFQFGVLVDWGDHNAIRDNTIVSTTRWTLDPADPDFLVETDGIVVMNGTDASVVNNDVSVAMFGFMGCIDGGRIKGNTVDGCLVGIAFCRVPDGVGISNGQKPTLDCERLSRCARSAPENKTAPRWGRPRSRQGLGLSHSPDRL